MKININLGKNISIFVVIVTNNQKTIISTGSVVPAFSVVTSKFLY